VVWERRRSSNTPNEEDTVDFIPFLSVSRSLGDFWSWSEQTQKFVVSPHPDVSVHPLDLTTQRFIVVASDGLWNVMSPQAGWLIKEGKVKRKRFFVLTENNQLRYYRTEDTRQPVSGNVHLNRSLH